MKRLGNGIAAIGAVATLLATSPVAHAADGDLRLGTFDGVWCGYGATFHIERQDANSWVFHGHVSFDEHPDFDELWIEQYEDNSLRMIRYLSGEATGMTQTVQTHPPDFQVSGVAFTKQQSYGPDCEAPGDGQRIFLPNQ